MGKDAKSLNERLKSGETVLGTWNIIPSPAVVEAIGYSGMDFVVIDTEHGPVSIESAENLVRAAEVASMTPIIRVPSNESHLILRALDIGAYGVQVPHVSTKKEAQQVVEYAKYYPQGKRGLSPFTRAGKYGLGAKDHVRLSNEKTLIILNVEGTEGIKNLDEIAAVKNIDVIFVGPYDLSQSLGKPGQVRDQQIIKAIRNSVSVAEKKGIACGSFACDREYLELLIECGVRYLTYTVDSALILQDYKEIYDFFRSHKTKRKR